MYDFKYASFSEVPKIDFQTFCLAFSVYFTKLHISNDKCLLNICKRTRGDPAQYIGEDVSFSLVGCLRRLSIINYANVQTSNLLIKLTEKYSYGLFYKINIQLYCIELKVVFMKLPQPPSPWVIRSANTIIL